MYIWSFELSESPLIGSDSFSLQLSSACLEDAVKLVHSIYPECIILDIRRMF